MAAGAKGNETRSWPTSHRGPLAISAAKHWDQECEQTLAIQEVQDALRPLYGHLTETLGRRITKEMLPFGRVLCVVHIKECVNTEILKADWREGIVKPLPNEGHFGNYQDGRFAWVTDVNKLLRLFLPVNVRGGQRIFNLPPEVERLVREQWKFKAKEVA